MQSVLVALWRPVGMTDTYLSLLGQPWAGQTSWRRTATWQISTSSSLQIQRSTLSLESLLKGASQSAQTRWAVTRMAAHQEDNPQINNWGTQEKCHKMDIPQSCPAKSPCLTRIQTITAKAHLLAPHIKRQTSMARRMSLLHTMSNITTQEMDTHHSATIMIQETETKTEIME